MHARMDAKMGRFCHGDGGPPGLAGRVTAGDDNQSSGLLGRLFRMGGGSSGRAATATVTAAVGVAAGSHRRPVSLRGSYYNSRRDRIVRRHRCRRAVVARHSAPAARRRFGRGVGPLPTFGGLPETPTCRPRAGRRSG